MDEATRKEIFGLRARFEALRTSIFSYLVQGISDSDWRVVQARHKQRMIAEELSRKDPSVKGIGLDREGDLAKEQIAMAAKFEISKSPRPQEQLDWEGSGLDPNRPLEQIVKLDTLHFKSEAGNILPVGLQPNQVLRMESLRMEGKASSILNRTLSVLEGTIGVDYVYDKDPESEIEFYVPITGGNDGD